MTNNVKQPDTRHGEAEQLTEPDGADQVALEIGDRVQHTTYGHGSVISVAKNSAVVKFDDGKHGNFSFDYLAPSEQPAPKPPAAANDNAPDPRLARILRFKAKYGGEVHTNPVSGPILYRAEIDGEKWSIGIGDDGEPFKFQIGKPRQPISEPQVLEIVNPAEWHGQPVPERDWYIPDLVPARQVTILNGDGGVGKSLLALQIAAAGAMAVETLGLEPEAGRTVYLGAEDEADEFQRRLADIARAHDRSLADLGDLRILPAAGMDALLALPDRSGTLQPTALWRDIVEFAESYRPRLVVLDTAADLFGGDEIKRSQVRQFIGMLRKLAIDFDCAVILLAHPSADGIKTGTGSSGSTAWSNSVRSRLYLTRDKDDDDLRVLKTMKSNYSTIGGEIRMRWRAGSFVLDDGKPSPVNGILNRRAETVFKDILSIFNRTGQSVSDVTGTNYAPAKMAKHPDASGISKKALAEAMQRLLDAGEVKIVMDGPPSRQRKRLILAAEDFGEPQTF